jgi:hypothetical protein
LFLPCQRKVGIPEKGSSRSQLPFFSAVFAAHADRIEQVDRYAGVAECRESWFAQSQHPPQLEDHQRARNDLPGMINVGHRQAEDADIARMLACVKIGAAAASSAAISRRRAGIRSTSHHQHAYPVRAL